LLSVTFALSVVCVLALTAAARPARAAFPGENGKIAFTSTRTGDAEIFVMDADGTDVRQVTSDPAQDLDPAFSADGSRIAFASDRDGNRELYVIGFDGAGETRLTSSPANEEDPAFSADGSRLAFVRDRDGNREIYVAAADGAAPVRLTFDPAADYQPNFAPDGSGIAFTSERVGGIGRIHVMGADGSAPMLLSSSDTSADHDPSFSPDGAKVGFAGDFICPPGYGCGQILAGAIYSTASDGLSERTAVQPGIPLADLDWGVATAGSPPEAGAGHHAAGHPVRVGAQRTDRPGHPDLHVHRRRRRDRDRAAAVLHPTRQRRVVGLLLRHERHAGGHRRPAQHRRPSAGRRRQRGPHAGGTVLHRRHGRAHRHRHDPGRSAADPHGNRDVDAQHQRSRALERRQGDARKQHRRRPDVRRLDALHDNPAVDR